MTNSKVTLFQKGAYGTNVWSIRSDGNLILIEANGQSYSEEVKEGLAGRSLKEQVELRIQARIRNKLDQGFVRSESLMRDYKTNQLGLPLPMLAKKYTSQKNRLFLDQCYYQPKLNGHRCIVTNLCGSIVAYSRRGKWINVIDHILRDIDIPEGMFLDGELYLHGKSLQSISSLVKRDTELPETKNIEYHVYDCFQMDRLDLKFAHRINFLHEGLKSTKSVRLVETNHFSTQDLTVNELLHQHREQGYEGLILRHGSGIYGIGKRPNDLIKVKFRHDAEFLCVKIEPTREGWGNLVLATQDGTEFKCTAPGTIADKIHVLENPEQYINKMVTCEFAELTESGKPFHCVAIGWRNDI